MPKKTHTKIKAMLGKWRMRNFRELFRGLSRRPWSIRRMCLKFRAKMKKKKNKFKFLKNKLRKSKKRRRRSNPWMISKRLKFRKKLS